jgi:hypothetical protein
MTSVTLSTRCAPQILEQMKKTALSQDCTLREIIERAWKTYHATFLRKQIIDSYAQLDADDVSIAEEDMAQYFTQLESDGV